MTPEQYAKKLQILINSKGLQYLAALILKEIELRKEAQERMLK